MRPPGQVTQEEIESYARDGVVCLRDAIPKHWVETLLNGWARRRRDIESGKRAYHLPPEFLADDPRLASEMAAIDRPDRTGERTTNKFLGGKWMWYWDADYRDFALNSPAGEIVGRVIQADEVRFYWDQMFVKDAGCNIKTYWHADYPAWPVSGEMIPSLWIALSEIGKESCVETVAGTHRDMTMQWPRSYNARQLERPVDRPDFIDYEERRSDPSLRILSFDMQPGDAILIHPRVHHGGGDNPDLKRDRVALSTRWLGNDIRWDPRPECVNTPGYPLDKMVHGGRPGDRSEDARIFPVVWRRGDRRRNAAE